MVNIQKIGKIEKINKGNVPTKFGPKEKTNIIIEGQIYSKWGKNEDSSKERKPFTEGDKVLIDYDVNNEYNNIKTIILVQDDFKKDETPKVKLPIEQPSIPIRQAQAQPEVSPTVERAVLKEICAKLATIDNSIENIDHSIANINTRILNLERNATKEHVSNNDLEFV